MALWDGRFTVPPAPDMVRFSQSLDVDLQMWQEDILGSRAHAAELNAVGILTDPELRTLLDGLDRVAEDLSTGAFVPGPELEDVHMAVESHLIALVGDVGKKLHTARSRNDQVATDLRLWLRRHLTALRLAQVDLVAALLDRIEADGDTLIPGFTHLQRGQPVLLGHHLLAHAWPVVRDAGRLSDALIRMDACPLGAGAMAGTPHPIDRTRTAKALGFSRPVPNAMDAVSSRDHVLETSAACAIAMAHLSRQAEELVIWSSQEFGLVRLDDAYATGSSIMPQKRNPDAPELVRGKAGRVFGDLQALLVMVKGLPLAYNRDLQEDRAALFDAVHTTRDCVQILAGVWRTLTVRRERYETELQGDFLLATELADHLVTRGVPFREAHHVVGRIVAWCEAQGGDLSLLDPARLATFHPELDAAAFDALDPRRAVIARQTLGGTSPAAIAEQVRALRAWVAESATAET